MTEVRLDGRLYCQMYRRKYKVAAVPPGSHTISVVLAPNDCNSVLPGGCISFEALPNQAYYLEIKIHLFSDISTVGPHLTLRTEEEAVRDLKGLRPIW